MKKVFYLLFFMTFNCAAACDVTPAKRIISLAPDITEILFTIGAGKNIIGTVNSSDYPKAAKKIPRVGSYSGLDLERMLAMKPDLIIVWGNSFARQLEIMKKFGVRVYTVDPKRLQDISAEMREFGCLVGNMEAANKAADSFVLNLQTLKQDYAKRKKQTVFFQLGDYSLITINKTSWINDVIELCGGKNIFADAVLPAPEVSWEAVVVAHPNVVIQATRANHPPACNVDPDLIERAGPRILAGVARVCECIGTIRATLRARSGVSG